MAGGNRTRVSLRRRVVGPCRALCVARPINNYGPWYRRVTSHVPPPCAQWSSVVPDGLVPHCILSLCKSVYDSSYFYFHWPCSLIIFNTEVSNIICVVGVRGGLCRSEDGKAFVANREDRRNAGTAVIKSTDTDSPSRCHHRDGTTDGTNIRRKDTKSKCQTYFVYTSRYKLCFLTVGKWVPVVKSLMFGYLPVRYVPYIGWWLRCEFILRYSTGFRVRANLQFLFFFFFSFLFVVNSILK